MATTAHVKLRIREGKGFKRLITASANGERYSVKVGFLGDGSDAREGEEMTNPRLAALLEYGYPEGNLPARPAVGPAWDANLKKYQELSRRLAEGVASGKVDLEKGLGLLGAQMAADLRDFIVGGASIAPENAPSVKARKERKSSGSPWGVRTWVDTGALVQSIAWVVVKGDG